MLMPSAYAPAVGGVEETTRNLAEQLRSRGDAVEVWAPRHRRSTLESREIVQGIPVRRFPMALPPLRAGDIAAFVPCAIGVMRDLRDAVRSFRPEVLHVQCFGANGAWATMASRLWNVPLVVTLQGETLMDDHDIYERSVALRVALRSGIRQATVVTGCSGFALADAERRFGLEPGRGRVVFNGVDTSESTSAALEVPFDRYVLALGRVVDKKGFDLLLRAFARVARQLPGVGLVIGGEGPALAGLRDLAHTCDVAGRAWFPGSLSRSQVSWVMKHAEVFVLPSRIEPFGIVALEAWRAATPLVATVRGGPSEFVKDDHDGLLADPFDEDALAGAILRLLTDRGASARLADEGRARVKDFYWTEIVGQYRELYESALRRPTEPGSGCG